MNELTKIPESIFSLKNLRKLDLSFNKLTKLDFVEGTWPNLETFNLSGNDLEALPSQIIACVKLQRLYANYNKLNFEGLWILLNFCPQNLSAIFCGQKIF